MSEGSPESEQVDERTRERLLDRVYRTSSTVGREIPDSVDIDGETVPIRDVYLDLSGRDSLDAEAAGRVEEILSYLRRRRMAAIERVKSGSITSEQGEALVDRVHTLDRTIDAFESLSEPDYAESVRRERIASAQELVDMLREFGKL